MVTHTKRRTPKPTPEVVFDDRPGASDAASERARMLGSDDPLTRALAPPPGETPHQRAVRLQVAAEAKRISDLIDEELNRQRAEEKKGPKPVKILLLGEFNLRTILNMESHSDMLTRTKRVWCVNSNYNFVLRSANLSTH